MVYVFNGNLYQLRELFKSDKHKEYKNVLVIKEAIFRDLTVEHIHDGQVIYVESQTVQLARDEFDLVERISSFDNESMVYYELFAIASPIPEYGLDYFIISYRRDLK